MEDNNLINLELMNTDDKLLQLIIDCSVTPLITERHKNPIDTICRNLIYALHVKRSELLN